MAMEGGVSRRLTDELQGHIQSFQARSYSGKKFITSEPPILCFASWKDKQKKLFGTASSLSVLIDIAILKAHQKAL